MVYIIPKCPTFFFNISNSSNNIPTTSTTIVTRSFVNVTHRGDDILRSRRSPPAMLNQRANNFFPSSSSSQCCYCHHRCNSSTPSLLDLTRSTALHRAGWFDGSPMKSCGVEPRFGMLRPLISISNATRNGTILEVFGSSLAISISANGLRLQFAGR